MWYDESVIYQIYPLGLCGAPKENDGICKNRIKRVIDFIPHLCKMNINAVYFCPVFESSSHGYDTKDFGKIDCRLGTNRDFKEVCDALHQKGIRVILDGVFNHVGRDFRAFRDVREKKWDSPYKDWFKIDFGGNSGYNDGFYYEGWEGHYELVKLNLYNSDVKNHIFSSIKSWVEEFGIDGLRLDVAYLLDRGFLKELRSFCKGLKEDFFLAGEMIGGNYSDIVNPEMTDSATNYECYKGIFSSFNSMNMFEIGHSLKNRFGSEPWCMYKGMNLIGFLDNHDVSRIASTLTNPQHIIPAYGILFSMPGIPSVYYGSEWGEKGRKEDGDNALRPEFCGPVENEITEFVAKASLAHRKSKALCYGNIEILCLTNKQLVFERKYEDERVIVMINADDAPYTAHYNANAGCGTDLISGSHYDFGGGSEIPPYGVLYIKTE